MKTLLLRSAIILCLLFLGFKNAEAAITVNDISQGGSDITVTNIYSGQTDVGVAGMQIVSTNNSTSNLTSITFTTNQPLTGAFTGAQLVTSTDPYPANAVPANYTVLRTTTNGTLTPAIATTGGVTTITFTNFSSQTRNGTNTYYLILDYTGTTTGTGVTFTTSAYTATNTTNSIAGFGTNTFNLVAPLLTETTDNNGLSATTLTTGQTAIPIYGVALSSNGTSTFNGFSFTTTTNPVANISPDFVTPLLYSSTTSSTFSTGTAAKVTGAVFGALTGTTLSVTFPTQTIANNTTTYYFIVFTYAQPTVTTQFTFNSPTIATTGTTTTTGTATGQTYTLTAPPVTVTATSLGSGGSTPTNGLTGNPIAATATGLPIYGLQLTPSATGATKNITAINFNTAGSPTAQANNYFIAKAYLYASATDTYAAGGSPIATINAPTGNTLNFTGLSIPVNAGTPLYYFVVVDYNTPVTATDSYTLTFASTTGVTSTGTPAGFSYNFPALTVAAASLGSGGTNGLTTDPIAATATGLPIYGLQLTPSATGPTRNITSINFNTAGSPTAQANNYFIAKAYLYASATNSYVAGGSPIATLTAPTGNTLNFTGLSIPVTAGTPLYYFVVVDYNTPVTATDSYTLTFASTTGVTSTGTPAGFSYNFPALTVAATSLGSAGTNGLTTDPIAATATGLPIYGLQLTPSAAGPSKTITAINFNTAGSPTAQANNYFIAKAYLYASATDTYAAGGSPIATINAPTGNTLNFTGLSIPVTAGTPLYYFVVVDYNTPVTATDSYTLTFASTTGVTSTGTPAGFSYNFPALTVAATSLGSGGASPTNGLSANPIAAPATGLPIYGLQLTPSAAGPSKTITAINFNTAGSPTAQPNNYFIAKAYLYASATNTYVAGGSPIATLTAPTGNTLNFTGLSIPVTAGTPLYYFVVVDYNTPVTTTDSYTLTFASTTGVTSTGTPAGFSYSFTALTVTATSLGSGGANPTNGLTANPIVATATGLPIYGLQLTPSASGPSKTITAINFNTAGSPTAQANNYFIAKAYLYASATNSYVAGGSPIATINAPTGNTLNFTGLSILVNAGTPLYYFVVVDYNTPVAATDSYTLTFASATGITTTGTPAGFSYSFPAITITASSLGATGANPTNGLLASPVYPPITGAIYGLQLLGSGTGPAQTITSLTFNPVATNNNSYYYQNMYLYSSTSSTFMGVGAPQTSTSPLATATAINNTANVTFSGLNISVSSGTPTLYYFVVIDYPGDAGTSSSELDYVSATGANVTTGTNFKGFNYSYRNPAITVASNNAGAYVGNLDHDLPQTVFFSFSAVATAGTGSVTGYTFTGTTNILTMFPTLTLYSSTSPTFPGTASATLVKTVTPASSTTLTINGLTESITGTKLYYYLVGDYTDKITDATTSNYRFVLTGVTTSAAVTGLNQNGTNYTLSAPVTLDNPTFSNVAVNPLKNSATNIDILGFSVATTQAESFNKFVLTASTGTISPYFTGTPILYVNSTASSSGAVPVPTASYTVTSTTITITLSTPQNFTAAGTKYYYLEFPTYTTPATATTFELDCTSASTTTSTFTNGAPSTGTLYNLGPVTYDWTGAATPVGGLYPWTTVGNWRVNGATSTTYPGQNGSTSDIVNIGVNVTYTHQPNLSANITVASMFFGYDGPQSNYQTTPNTLVLDNIILTVNTGSTLTVTGNITQNHDASAAGSNFNFSVTTFAGLGTLICQGNLLVGDVVTQPAFTVAVVTQVTSQINQLTINGNLILTTNGNGNPTPAGNRGICYAYFSLEKGTTKILKQIKFSTNNNPLASLFDTYNPGITTYQGYGLFTVDKTTTGSGPCTLELPNIQPIVPADKFYVHFTFGGNSGTVLYDDPNAGDSQVIYTANEPSATTTQTYIGTTSPNCYYNLAFAGPSTKVVDPNSTLTIAGGSTTQGLTMGGTWTTDGGIVDLKTHDPTVIVGGAWNNTTTINHDAGPITVGGMFSNNVSGDASGTLNCGTADITFKGGYTNNATFVANATGNINFTPATAETITDNSTFGTTFNNVNFTSGTTTINAGISTIGNIAVSNVGKLKMSGTAKLVAGTLTSGGTGYLTLMSDAVSTATAYTPSGTSITGNVNVQRWITGGSGYRGYRLFSSPVNVSLNTGGSGNLALGYLGANGKFANNTYLGAFTEGPGTGFTYNGSFNPIIYLYDETRPSTNQGFTAGKNIGIYSITGNTVTTLTSNVQQANVSIPVGNSYLLYYVGDNHLTDQTAVLTTRTPESTPVTATGYLNQGNVVVSFWKNNSTTIPYDINGGNLPGLNQVGNPYASTIKLSQFYTDNTATGISPQFWVLDATTGLSGTYISYNASSGATSSTKSGNYVVSGQGFLVQATGTGSGANLTFKEDQKVDYPAITSTSGAPNGALVMSIPSSPGVSNSDVIVKSFAQINPVATGSVLTGLHLQLSKDTTAYTQTGVYFSTQWSDAYSAFEDAMDLDGATPKVYLSSYSSDGKRLSINELGDYAQGKRIKLYAGATTSGAYSISLADFMNIDTVNYNIFLVDRKMNDSLDMVRYKSYAFTINNSDTSTYGANRFVLVIAHAPVPQYVLNSFTGKKVPAGIQLTWLTTNASNYTGYVLQKADINGNYNDLYSAQSDKGEVKYSYIDQNPVIGNNTYRLAQNDVNGKITYSNPLTIIYNKNALAKVGLSVYPNPSNSIINVIYTDKTSTDPSPNYTVDIFNAAGTFIKHEAINTNSWTENISSFKLGVYLLQLKDNTGNLVGQTKFIKNL